MLFILCPKIYVFRNLSESEPESGGQINFEEDSYARSPTSSVRSEEDESRLLSIQERLCITTTMNFSDGL